MRALAAIAGLIATIAGGASAQETISKTEIRAAPPEQTHERLRDVVWDMFELGDFRRDETGTRPLDVLAFSSRPHLTRTANLCRFSRLTVSFAPVDLDADEEAAGAETAVAAQSFLASSWWSFVEPPRLDEGWQSSEGQDAGLCDDLPEDQHFSIASDRGAAGKGYLALVALKQFIADGRVADGACDADCQNLIASVPNEDLRKVERCNPDILDWCYRLHFPELRIGVQFNGSPRGGDVHVVGVEAAQLIVLAHPRPD